MSLSKSKCWFSNNCLHFLKCAVPLWILAQVPLDIFLGNNSNILVDYVNAY